MSMKRRWLSVTSLLVAVGLLAGCSGGSDNDVAENGDVMELECMVDMNTINTDSVLIKEMEEELGVKINFTAAPTGSADDKRKAINLQISSGDMPEMIADVKFSDYYTYAQQGLIAEIPVEMIKSEAPDVVSWIENNLYGENSWDYYKIDGKNYVVPTIWTIGEHFAALIIRQDWLEDVGINKIPETLDEMETTLVKFKEAKGGYPLLGGLSVCSFIYGAHGVYQFQFTEKDGEVIYGPVTPEGKQALEVAHRWYEMGLIDPEFVINTEDQVREKWIAEKAGVSTAAFYHAIPAEAYWGGVYYDNLIEKNPNAKPVVMMPPAGPNGERGTSQESPIVNAGVVFSKELEKQPEKLKKYLQLCNYELKEMKKLNLGKEGETYQYDAEGNVEWIPPYDNEDKRKEYGIAASGVVSGFFDYDVDFNSLRTKEHKQIIEDAMSKCVGEYDVLGPVPRPIWQEKQEALNRIAFQNMADFVTGTRDLSEFDAFVQEWYSAGGTEVMQEAQEYFEKLGLNNRAQAE